MEPHMAELFRRRRIVQAWDSTRRHLERARRRCAGLEAEGALRDGDALEIEVPDDRFSTWCETATSSGAGPKPEKELAEVRCG